MEPDIIMDPWSHTWDKLTGRRDGVDVRCQRGEAGRKSKMFHRACEPIIEAFVENRYHRTRFENRNSNIQQGRRK